MFVIRHVSDYSRLQPDHCVVGLAAVSFIFTSREKYDKMF